MTDINNFTELTDWLTSGADRIVRATTSSNLYDGLEPTMNRLQSLATYDPRTGTFTGGSKFERYTELKQMLDQNETFTDFAGSFENGDFKTMVEKNKAKISREFPRVIGGIDTVEKQLERYEEAIGKQMQRQSKELSRTYKDALRPLQDDLKAVAAGPAHDAARRAAQQEIENLNGRYQSALNVLHDAAEPHRALVSDMRSDINALVKEMEEATGLKAAEFRKAGSHVAKLEKGAESLVKEGEKAGSIFSKTSVKVALGAVVTLALAKALGFFDSKPSQSAAR